MIKNLTLALDEDLLQKARVLAAMKRTSVNEMVREFLTRTVQQEGSFDEVSMALIKLAEESPIHLEGPPMKRADIYSGEKRFER
jgi:plasmid stability protein